MNGHDLGSFVLFLLQSQHIHSCLLDYTMKVYKSIFTGLHSDRYTMEHNGAQCRFTLVKEAAPAK